MLLPRRSAVWAYAIALLGSGLIVATRHVLGDSGGVAKLISSMEFVVCVLAAGMIGGWKPGVVATIASPIAFMFFFVEPVFSFTSIRPRVLLGAAPFLIVGLAISVLCEGLHSALRRSDDRQRRLELEIAERRRAELSELDQAERLRVTLASIGDAVITTDAQGRVTYLNTVAESLTGWKAAEACGQALEKVFRIVSEQTRAAVESPVTRVLRDGYLAGLGHHTLLLSRDGTGRPIDDSAAPIRDRGGTVVGVVMIFRDVSERRRAERALQTAVFELKIVTESMSALISRCSRELKYLWVSKPYADWIGRLPDEIVGRSIEEVLGDEAYEQLLPYFERVLSGEEVRYEEAANIGGRGRRWISAVYSPTFDAAGETDGWVAVVVDIDEKKRAEKLLLEADRRKDEFLATLAHELRNPLAPIWNAVQYLQMKGPLDEDLVAARETIDRQVRQMTHLIDDLLDVSRISHNTLSLRMEQVELGRAVRSGLEAAQPLIEAAGHQLTVNVPAGPVYLNADATRLAQIVTNLLNNAVKYTDHGGRIAVNVERQGSEVVVTVKDNGIGIPPDVLPKVFDMFSQADQSIERSRGGLGIGLTLVKRLVELHSGSIEARSAGAGSGSEFIVRLPVVNPMPVERRPGAGKGAVGSTRLPGTRILVVDDNKDAADTLAKILKMIGGELQTAYDGRSAFDAACAFRPEIVFLDIGLPEMNGHDVCRLIREQPWGRDMTMIALTGWGQNEDRQKSKGAGFDHHVVKPADFHAIMKVLHAVRAEAV